MALISDTIAVSAIVGNSSITSRAHNSQSAILNTSAMIRSLRWWGLVRASVRSALTCWSWLVMERAIRSAPSTSPAAAPAATEDWHVILVAGISAPDNLGDPWSLQQARVDLDPVILEFILDGSPLATSRTAIKRFLGFEDTEAYYFRQGAILPPGALTVGSHTLSLLTTSPIETSTDGIIFHIDASGTGAYI
jgi:hypothetical protein